MAEVKKEVVNEDALADLTSRAEELGFEIFCDGRWGYILRRIDRDITNPASQADLDDLSEMLDGIEWGREHRMGAQGTASR